MAKQSIQRLVNALDGDRVGLVIFAGDAFVQCPITTDYGALKLFLDGVTTDLVPVQGTAVGRAIEVCANGFDPESPASKMIVVFTDGENHEDDAVAMAEDVLDRGIEVHTIGMGTPSGAPIPLDRFGRSRGSKSDGEGNPIVTVLDETTLIQVAEAGNGTYVQAGVGFVNLSPVIGAMSGLNQTETSTIAYTDFTHHFHWFFFDRTRVHLCGKCTEHHPQTSFSMISTTHRNKVIGLHPDLYGHRMPAQTDDYAAELHHPGH